MDFDIGDHVVEIQDQNMFRVSGLDPKDGEYGFCIKLNSEFADELRSVSVSEKQESTVESLVEMYLGNDFASVRFYGDSFLLSNITVAPNATGLDHFEEKRGSHHYYTHNVDCSHEAIEIISVFSKWVQLGQRILVGES